jgi:malonyl-CoA O-methyltransferase
MLMLDKKQMRLSFDRAASHYDDSAVLQREVADRLLSRLEMIKYQPRRILDLGCGTGYCAEHLQRRYKKSEYIGMDIAHHMVTTARSQHGRWFRRQRWLCADAETIPLADNSIDMVVSNLTLQWCDAPRVFAELARVLRPAGLLMFSSFGPDTLYELRSAWAQVDDYPHVHDFVDMHDLGDTLMRLAYGNPVVDIEKLTLTYDNIKSLLLDLKNIGAHNVASQRISGLMGKQHFQNFSEAYRQQFQQEGRLPATYEVIYGHAWAPQQSAAAQTQSVSLENLKAGAD